MIKKNLTSSIILVMMLLITPCVSAQTYRQIKGWSKEVNDRLEDFLNSTITMKIRKVAVFDGDGTVMGQVPHYLADEALYQGVHALDLAPKKAAGTAAGFTGFFGYFFGTALFANIGLGYVVQNLGWNWNFIVLLVACALAFIFIGFTAKEEQYLVKQAKQ